MGTRGHRRGTIKQDNKDGTGVRQAQHAKAAYHPISNKEVTLAGATDPNGGCGLFFPAANTISNEFKHSFQLPLL